MGDSSGPALFLQSSAGFEPDGGQLRTRRFHSGNRHGTAMGYAKSKKFQKGFARTGGGPSGLGLPRADG